MTKDFIKLLAMKVENQLGSDISVTTQTILKNNSLSRDAMIIRSINEDSYSVSPVIYLDDIYNEYESGMSLDDCALAIVKKYLDVTDSKLSHVDCYCSKELIKWDYVKENVYPVLISTKRNLERLGQIVSRSFLDLSVIFQVRFNGPDGTCYSTNITKALLKIYDGLIDEETLEEHAIGNLRKDGYGFYNMEDILKEFYPGGEKPEPVSNMEDGMFLLLNRDKKYAAAGILDFPFIRKATNGRNFYVLPSSIHELIFIPADSCSMDMSMLTEMVQQVNEGQVLEHDILSDHAYFYNGKTGELQYESV